MCHIASRLQDAACHDLLSLVELKSVYLCIHREGSGASLECASQVHIFDQMLSSFRSLQDILWDLSVQGF